VSFLVGKESEFHFHFLQRLVKNKNAKKIPDEYRERLVNTLNTLDSFLADDQWIAGENVTIADYSVLATVTTVKVGHVDLLLIQTALDVTCCLFCRNWAMT